MKNYRYVFLFLFVPVFVHAFEKNEPGLIFIENKNQWPEPVDFALKIPGGQMFIQPGCFHYYLIDRQKLEDRHHRTHAALNEAGRGTGSPEMIDGCYIKINFPGANTQSVPQSIGELSSYYNYILGNDSTHWASHAHSYSGVYYPDFYDGIAMKLYGLGTNLKYDYIVKPNADPSMIQVEYSGADRIELHDGNLIIKTSLGEIIENKPYAYQFINGKKTGVRCDYVLHTNRLSFSFPDGYDPCHELTIDPLLVFSTYAGSTADSWGSTATPGEHGCLYSSGVTQQYITGGKFPATTGAFQRTSAGFYDIGILKYDSTGQQLLYATYLGGELDESPHSLVVNSDEELVVLGTVSSQHFPTTVNAFSRTFSGGSDVRHVIEYTDGSDIFVARLSADGSKLLASTYLGGSANDGLNDDAGGLVKNYGDQLRGDIITDAANNVYISSVTASADFPVKHGVDTTYNGGKTDAILLKLDPALSEILWGTFIGGSGTDASHTLKFDRSGNIFIAGGTNSVDFPVNAGRYQSSLTGGVDGWIAHIASGGDSILNATFTGTSDYDQIYFLDLNEADEVFVYGQTSSASFPLTTGVYSNPGSGQFLQKFDTELSSLKFSTVFGSGRRIPDISPTAFMVNECGNIFMSGWGGLINSDEGFWPSDTYNMPVTPDAYQKTTSGSDFYFIVLSSDATQFLYGTYLGGTQSRTHVDGGTSRFDKTGIVYHAVCSGCQAVNATKKPTSDFPTTPNAWSRVNRSENCNNAAFKFDLAILKAKAAIIGADRICIPDKAYFVNKSIGGRLFEWDFGDGTHIVKTDTASIAHQYKNPGTYIVKLKAHNDGTCVGIDSTQTLATVFAGQTIFPKDDVMCAGSSYQFSVSGGVSYQWRSTDGSFISNDADPVVAPQDTTEYLLFVTEASGCERRDTVELGVIPSMDMNFDQKIISDCFSRPSIEVINRTDAKGTDIVFFDFGDGQTSDGEDVVHKYENDNLYHVRIVGVRDVCSFEKQIDVPVFTVKIPNVITPESAGYNDRFVVMFGEKDQQSINPDESNIPTPGDYGIPVSVIVYNRWGTPVYSSTDYKNDWKGSGLASGVYYYEVTIQGYVTCKDWIHVIK